MNESPSLTQTLAGYRRLITFIKGFGRTFSDGLSFDLLLTFVCSVFWLFFAWQHGYNNSPDSWYRGLLGKSLVEGHPYFVNIKQGWLYNFGPWHHDASHSPLLPVIYAIFFLIFGYKISIANIIVSLSAGLLIFPLLRLSRKMFGTPWAGFIIYLLSAFNQRNDWLFEVFAGLSIPTSVMLLAFFFFFVWRLIESGKKGPLLGAIISAVAFFYIRPGEQVIVWWLLFWSLALGGRFLARSSYEALKKMWLWTGALTAPWLIRNIFLFKQPFFSHTTAALWTDRGYDYWTYHEHLPLPTAAAYFQTHTWLDFFKKLFVQGPGNYFSVFGQTLNGPLWVYFLAFIISVVFIFAKVDGEKPRFLFFTVATTFVGYLIIYSLVPVLDNRYMMLPFFLISLTIISALFFGLKDLPARPKLFFYSALLLAVFLLQQPFWTKDFVRQFSFSFANSDQRLRDDPLIEGLKNRLSKNDVILGPFAEVQRLNFATGLTLIEEPDNLKRLTDPAAFFRKYKIRYSLVDVSHLLPAELIEKVELAGDRLLFTIRGEAASTESETPYSSGTDLLAESSLATAIQTGLRKRFIYFDAFHASEPSDLTLFNSLGLKTYIGYNDFVANKDKLFHCGLLLMNYEQGKRELTDEESLVIKQYIANGGRLLLFCPAWVWVAYEKKGLERLPFNRIAENYGILLTSDYVTAPFKIIGKDFSSPLPAMNATFSRLIYPKEAEPFLVGAGLKTGAVAAKKRNSRIIVWGQNNLLNSEFALKPQGRKFMKGLFDWLLANP